jgi:hypothetical protein
MNSRVRIMTSYATTTLLYALVFSVTVSFLVHGGTI